MDEIVILVAGNPDLYPLEYYDAQTQEYEGVIPRLMERFSEESGYEVQYLQSGSRDIRDELAENEQVDLISGCVTGEYFRNIRPGGLVLLESVEEGNTVVYQMYFTNSAPEPFLEDFRQFISDVSQEERIGMVLQEETQTRDVQAGALWKGIVGLSGAVLILLGTLAAVFYRYRKRLKKSERDNETDEITGLGNEAFFHRAFSAMVTDRTRALYTAVCFYTDTNKADQMEGHEDTRQFLRHTAAVLNEYTDQRDILARVSGAGFMMLKASQSWEKWLPTALARIREFSGMYGKTCNYETACGIYLLRTDDRDLDEIMVKILQSAQMAHRSGKDYVVCTRDVLREMDQERLLRREISEAFDRNEFQLYIQFYVDVWTQRIVGGEALARWQHPERGFLTPGSFIPMMEQEDMIDLMDYYVLEKVCGFLDQLDRLGIRDFFISCNFSRKSFGAPDFVQRCREILSRYSFDRELLIFELTESAKTQDAGRTLENTRRIREELGVKLVLDDVGAGFTSFFDMQEYPIDGIKLDKELADHINTPKGRAIMGAMVKIGHELGLTTLAEGVETDEQLNILQELNCDAVQGFRFYHPVPVWEAKEKILKDHAQVGGARQD